MADLLNESFEAAGYDLTGWTETVSAGSTLDEDYTGVARPSGGGNQCLRVVKAAADYDADARRGISTGDVNKSFTTVWFRLASEGLASGQSANIVRCSPSDYSTDRWLWKLYDTAGTITIKFSIYNNGGWVDYASPTISVDTWYRLRVKYDTTGGTFAAYIKADGGAETTIVAASFAGTYGAGWRWLRLGGTTNYAYEAFFDRAMVDSTAFDEDVTVYGLVAANIFGIIPTKVYGT